jgi:hypothetical protein
MPHDTPVQIHPVYTYTAQTGTSSGFPLEKEIDAFSLTAENGATFSADEPAGPFAKHLHDVAADTAPGHSKSLRHAPLLPAVPSPLGTAGDHLPLVLWRKWSQSTICWTFLDRYQRPSAKTP